MSQHFWKWVLYKVMGWKTEITVDLPEKCIICLAPHTSNMDFVIGQLFARAEGMKPNFLMKKEWFLWPLGPIFRRWGGIPVYRKQKHTSMTEVLTQTARDEEHFVLCITPEGTRSLNAEWKKGFYYIALGAQIPVLLYGLDYERKLIQCTKSMVPKGDIEQEMKEIKLYFKEMKGKYPENFTIGDIE
jgi:1-acyl-sn-glycerol-3-phosphate acyltransferase